MRLLLSAANLHSSLPMLRTSVALASHSGEREAALKQRVEVGVDLGVEPGQGGLRHGRRHLGRGGLGDGRRRGGCGEDERRRSGARGARPGRGRVRWPAGRLAGQSSGAGPSLSAGPSATRPKSSLAQRHTGPAGVRPLYVPCAWDGTGIRAVPPRFRGRVRDSPDEPPDDPEPAPRPARGLPGGRPRLGVRGGSRPRSRAWGPTR